MARQTLIWSIVDFSWCHIVITWSHCYHFTIQINDFKQTEFKNKVKQSELLGFLSTCLKTCLILCLLPWMLIWFWQKSWHIVSLLAFSWGFQLHLNMELWTHGNRRSWMWRLVELVTNHLCDIWANSICWWRPMMWGQALEKASK